MSVRVYADSSSTENDLVIERSSQQLSSVDIARRAISMDDLGFSMPNGSENPSNQDIEDQMILENGLQDIPTLEIADKVYIYIGVGICASGSMTVVIICILIYLDYVKNVHTNSKTDLLESSNKNETYINRVKITGFYTITKNDKNETYYQFNTDGKLYFLETSQCDVLLVGGGGGVGWGGGGLGGGAGTGGGGGGGFGEGKLTFYSNESYAITVGKGGYSGHNELGTNGKDTTIIGKSIHEIAYGGGAGGYYNVIGQIGGSSGGNYGLNGFVIDPLTGHIFTFYNIFTKYAIKGDGQLTYYGNNGGYGLNNTIMNSGSGGGGAGSQGGSPNKDGSGGNGGDGYLWTSNNKYYGGGGGGGGCSNCIGGKGGYGSGGDGNNKNKGGTNPVPYTGGGGGGGSTIGSGFGTGGASGTVIVGNCKRVIIRRFH